MATLRSNFEITQGLTKFAVLMLSLLTPILLLKNELGIFGESLLAEHGYEYPLVRLLRGFIDARNSGEYSDDTILTLTTNMVIIPDEPLRFLFGNNDFGQNGISFILTDVGFFRIWHGIGLVGLLIFIFGVFIIPIFKIYIKAQTKLFHARDKFILYSSSVEYKMLFVVLVFGLIANYKIIFMSSRVYLFIFFVLIFLVNHRLQTLNITKNRCGHEDKPCVA